jgi:hypothetical protein
MAPRQQAKLVAGRVSGSSFDDLLVVSGTERDLTVWNSRGVSHDGSVSQLQPAVTLRAHEPIVCAIPMRLSVMGSPGLVMLTNRTAAPLLLTQVPGVTYHVTGLSDSQTGACTGVSGTPPSSSCTTLRAAVIAANANPGQDAITFDVNGTITLTVVGLDDNAQAGDLDVTDALTIIGNGPANTVIQGGPSFGNGIDKVFSFNPLGAQPGFAVSISGLAIQFGTNHGTGVTDGNGEGGGFDFDAGVRDGAGSLAIANCSIFQNSTINGDGGGIALFDGGAISITNTAINGNLAGLSDPTAWWGYHGGGIYAVGGGAGYASNISIISSSVSNNTAATPGHTPPAQLGGGVYTDFPGIVILSSTISGNTASSDGGGLYGDGFVVGQGSVVSANVSGGNGGGIFGVSTVSNSTLAGNSAGSWGAALWADGPGAAVSNSRIVGNTSGQAASVVDGDPNYGATVAATGNWWGTNSSPANLVASGIVTFNPWLVMAFSALPATVTTGGNSALTASINIGNDGSTGFAVPDGTAVTFSGSLGAVNPSNAVTASGSAVSLFTAGANPGTASVSATVDSQTLSANIAIQLPPPPTLTSISPSMGNQGAIVPVTLTGTNFVTGASVAIANTGVTVSGVTVVSATQITLMLTIGGSATPGAASVTVSTAGGISGGVPFTVNSSATTTALASSLNPSNFGQSVTFTATVTGYGATPTGTMNFTVDGVSIGTGPLNGSGVASISTSTLAIGTRSVVATYSGDSSYSASTSSTLSQVVNTGSATVALQSSLNPSNVAQNVTFTATVTAQAGSGTPTSTVTFKDGVYTIGSAVLSGGVATFTTSSLSAGSHSITGVYSGDAKYTSATSPALPQTVNKLAPTVSVTSSVNPSVTGQLTTFTATVSGTAATPTGTVTITADGSSIGTITLSGGTGTLSVPLTATGATRSIVAGYGGDSNYNWANSSAVSQTVNAASTTIAVTASSNPAISGASLTFTATVSAIAPGQGTPTGTVTFSDGGNPLGTQTLTGGAATLSTSALSSGSHNITATYGGTPAFAASTSSTLTETISPGVTTVAVSSSQNPSVLGQSVTLTAQVTPSGAIPPGSTVQFLVGGSPFGSPVTLDGSGTGILTTTTLPAGTSSITAAYNSTTSGPLSQVVLVPVTVQASPAGAQFTVDGTNYTAPQTFNWVAGSSHSLAAPSTQALSGTSQLAFSGWSDAGAASHTITTPTAATAYTANFATQYLVQVNVGPTIGGSVTGAGYYTAGTTAILTATPAAGYSFSNWSGNATGSTNPISFPVNGPMLVGANFTPLAPSLSVAMGMRSDGADPGTRNVNVTLRNTGAGPGYNAQIVDVTSIVVKTGTGSVTLASGVPGPVPAGTLASGASETVPLVFNWPATATSATITFRLAATDATGTTTYTFSQTLSTIR